MYISMSKLDFIYNCEDNDNRWVRFLLALWKRCDGIVVCIFVAHISANLYI